MPNPLYCSERFWYAITLELKKTGLIMANYVTRDWLRLYISSLIETNES